jgi:predicted nucleic acid-binding protein
MNHSHRGVVVDASVALKWVIWEELAPQARQLLRTIVATDVQIIGPPHMSGEVANAIYQRQRSRDPRRHLQTVEAEEALAHYLTLDIELVTPTGLYQRAFEFARQQALPSLYDSLYVVTAQLLGLDLWTADRRLLGALGDSAPSVRFIGDYPAAPPAPR